LEKNGGKIPCMTQIPDLRCAYLKVPKILGGHTKMLKYALSLSVILDVATSAFGFMAPGSALPMSGLSR
jgi:hypothetical protein